MLVFNAQLFEHLLVLLDSGRETRPRVTKTNVLKTVGPAPPLYDRPFTCSPRRDVHDWGSMSVSGFNFSVSRSELADAVGDAATVGSCSSRMGSELDNCSFADFSI